jgi:hypothetical protein
MMGLPLAAVASEPVQAAAEEDAERSDAAESS